MGRRKILYLFLIPFFLFSHFHFQFVKPIIPFLLLLVTLFVIFYQKRIARFFAPYTTPTTLHSLGSASQSACDGRHAGFARPDRYIDRDSQPKPLQNDRPEVRAVYFIFVHNFNFFSLVFSSLLSSSRLFSLSLSLSLSLSFALLLLFLF